MNLLSDPLQYDFFRLALLAGILASIACGIIGSFVVVKRISSISGGLSHAAFGGLGIGFYLGLDPMLCAAGFCVICAIVLGFVYRRQKQSLDTLISMIWSVGMALGVLFVALTPGYARDLNSYLFGNILLVPAQYLIHLALLDCALLVVVGLLFRELQAVAFDEEFAEVSGVAVDPMIILLLVLTALTVVMLIRVVGVIMLIALLTTPAVIARHWSQTLRAMIVFATLIATVCTTVGLFGSFWISSAHGVNVPTGALIILLATFGYGFSALARRGVRGG